MKTSLDHELLKAIYKEMQELKKAIQVKDERRVGRYEFAKLLNIEPETLDARIRDSRYIKPYKDGRKSFWLHSYVQSVILDVELENKVA
ncbi:hypothetical protein [Acinetobacter sp. ANC 3813]|uniref:hypothetical protein n=1 Tax=Acinetobacter sp. ANC 3813 TaxID=1977873 RepID=UPI000A332078|nr:hypothetical protein B9T34_14375 [Acinetobacter sp. ANC 3813]